MVASGLAHHSRTCSAVDRTLGLLDAGEAAGAEDGGVFEVDVQHRLEAGLGLLDQPAQLGGADPVRQMCHAGVHEGCRVRGQTHRLLGEGEAAATGLGAPAEVGGELDDRGFWNLLDNSLGVSRRSLRDLLNQQPDSRLTRRS